MGIVRILRFFWGKFCFFLLLQFSQKYFMFGLIYFKNSYGNLCNFVRWHFFDANLGCLKIVLFHVFSCTLAFFTVLLLFSSTQKVLYSCTLLLYLYCTRVLLNYYTHVLSYSCILVLLCSCKHAHFYSFTLVILYSGSLSILYYCTLFWCYIVLDKDMSKRWGGWMENLELTSDSWT